MAQDLVGSCLCNVLAAGCTLLIITAFPIAEIVIGALYVHECPAAPVIPVYVTVWGTLTLLLIGLFALPKLVCPGAPGNTIWALSVLGLILLVLIWILFGSYHIYSVYPPNYNKTDANGVNGSVFSPVRTLDHQNQTLPPVNHTWMINDGRTLMKMIQRKSNQHLSNPTGEFPNAPRVVAAAPHCDRTVYLFAFWTTTLAHVLIGIFLGVIICLYACMKLSVSLVELVYS